MKTIAIVNLKGGVGKTVTAVNVAAILATEYGQRVLLIDADPQANATQSLLPPGEYNTLAGLLTIPDAYYDDLLYHSSIRGLDVLPADDELRNLDVDLLQGERPNLRAIRDLRDAVAEADAYDCIVIDCPPALSPACAAAIAASTDVVIPIKVDAYSVRGMNELTAQIDRLRSIYPDVHVAGCLPTMWYRSDTVEQGERLLQEQAPVHVFASHIRRSPKVAFRPFFRFLASASLLRTRRQAGQYHARGPPSKTAPHWRQIRGFTTTAIRAVASTPRQARQRLLTDSWR